MQKLVWTLIVFCVLLVAAQQALERGLLPLLMDEILASKIANPAGGTGEDSAKEPSSSHEEGNLYDVIRQALMEGTPSANIMGLERNISADQVFSVVERVVHETPEILYYEGVKYWNYGRLEFSYGRDRGTIQANRRDLHLAAESIIKREIKPGMTDYDKVLAVHDFIINNTRYDVENLNKGSLTPESRSAYGVLVQGKGVCEGYAKAMKLIMDRLGIPCLYVTGEADGEGHAWNMVDLEGRYYHLDVTWNDPVMPDGSQVLRYDYFNVTDREISVSHSWDRDLYPPCTSVIHNYYYQRGLVVHSHGEFLELLRLALVNKARILTFRVPDYDENTYDLVAAVEKIVSENPGITHKGFNYSLPQNKRIGVIRINFR